MKSLAFHIILVAQLAPGCRTPPGPPPTAHPSAHPAAHPASRPTLAPASLPSALRRPGLRVAGMTIGHPDAPVAIDHFTDFECPHCAQVQRVLVGLARRYPAQVRLRHRDFPLDSDCNRTVKGVFHSNACRAALFARCASLQGRFWVFAAQVFSYQRALSKDDLLGHGRQLGLDVEALAACVDLPAPRRALQEDIEEGIQRQVTGTPTTFLSLSGEPVETVVGKRSREWWELRVGRLIDRVNSSRTHHRPRAAPAPPP